jgi:hypothetical protein
MSASARSKRKQAQRVGAPLADKSARKAWDAGESVCLSCSFSPAERVIFDTLDEGGQGAMMEFRFLHHPTETIVNAYPHDDDGVYHFETREGNTYDMDMSATS